MANDVFSHGPVAGQSTPVHGGSPSAAGCNGCTDCCHLAEISVTDEEATRLRELYHVFAMPLGELAFEPNAVSDGWQVMKGPCVFRRLDTPLAAGGCRIYADRPGSCVIFSCDYLLALRRRDIAAGVIE